eukprot:SAG31_NODE_2672_length_5268_cov_41.402273_8_plen_76_part_00
MASGLVTPAGICRGLLEFHGHKPEALAHYDIKPGNVLLADDGRCSLTRRHLIAVHCLCWALCDPTHEIVAAAITT